MLNKRKLEFKRQSIGISQHAKQEVILQAKSILNSAESSPEDKKRASQTLSKLQAIESQFGRGQSKMARADKPENITRKFENGEELSKMFYDDEESCLEKQDHFWLGKDIVKMGALKLKCAFDKENMGHFLFFKKENGVKYSPTLFKVAFIELSDLAKKMSVLYEQILANPAGQKLPFLDTEFGSSDIDDENFYNDENVLATKSGSFKIRPFESHSGNLKFKLLSPRPSTKFAWAGPSLTASFLIFSGLLKYINYLLENYDSTKQE